MAQTIEQVLAAGGPGFFQTVGDSMEPILHNRRSTVVIRPAAGPLRPGDVALYRRPTGEYVLHRVIRVLDGAYLIRGDNRLNRETVPAGWILGVMAGYYADEGDAYVDCRSPAYHHALRRAAAHHRRLWLRALPGRLRQKLTGRR